MKLFFYTLLLFNPLSAKIADLKVSHGTPKVANPSERVNFPLTHHFSITPRVNVATGEYLEEEEDMVVAGCEPISLRRFYGHQGPHDAVFNYWRYNPEHFCAANLSFGEQEKFIAIGGKDGSIFSYKKFHANMITSGPIQGYVQRDLSGQKHPLNTKIFYEPTEKGRKEGFCWKGKVIEGDGTQKLFLSEKMEWDSDVRYYSKQEADYKWTSPEEWTPYSLPFYEIRQPNGNIISYCYAKDTYPFLKHPIFSYRIDKIVAYNSTKTKILGFIDFKYRKQHDLFLEAIGSDGRKVASLKGSTGIPDIDMGNALGKVERPNLPSIAYSYRPFVERRTHKSWITKLEKPEGRQLITEYDKDTGKVIWQKAPVGINDKMEVIARFAYAAGQTDSWDAENNKTSFFFDEQFRIRAIHFYNKEALYRKECFTWDSEGHLLTKTVVDEKGTLFYLEKYLYDKNHNVIEETIGDGKEHYTVYRTYSEDGFNLKLSERDDFGKDIRYFYLPNSCLLAAEFTYAQGIIAKRRFNFYNDCAACIKTIVDDGKSQDPADIASLTFRKIHYFTLKESLPCFGLPLVVEEKTLNRDAEEILVSKIVYSYTPFGKVAKEEHYDDQNILSYTIENSYDNKERLSSTTDALNQKTSFTYDANNNLLSFSDPLYTETITYDKANRPTKIISSEKVAYSYIYDRLGRVTTFIQEGFGPLCYRYNSAGKVTAIIHPDGATEKKEYDLFGNVVKAIDPLGNSTEKRYNFRGQVTFIRHPDGGVEEFSYRPDGKLLTAKDKNGAKKAYLYDDLGNCIEESTYLEDKFYRKESARYSAFSLLEKTTALGLITHFTYDFSGKKIAEEEGERTRHFAYDSLGRLSEEVDSGGKTVLHYDLLHRLIEKRVENLSREIFWQEKYAYDAHNNRTHVIREKAESVTIFNGHNEPVSITDFAGNKTCFSYIYKPDKVVTETSPKGNQKITYYDNRNRKQEEQKLNALSKTVHRTLYRYDLGSNLIEVAENVFQGTQLLKTLTYTNCYGKGNQLLSFTEANLRTTHYSYDEKGRLTAITKPKGTINSLYDDLGRLIAYSSSDFSYSYSYDVGNRLISVSDGETKTERFYDIYGNLTEEQLASGLTFKNRYDSKNRRLWLTLPDLSTINYQYNYYLYRVIRNKVSHSHIYCKRDLQGLVLQETLAQGCGDVNITRDSAGRIQNKSCSFYTAHFPENAYDANNNLQEYISVDGNGSQTHTYTYDALNQLVKEENHDYLFDSIHNCLEKDGTKITVDMLNQLSNPEYSYDEQGNMIRSPEGNYSYDSQDRLISVQTKEALIAYKYDPFHRRLSKTVTQKGKALTTRYLWDGQNEIGAINEKNQIFQLRVLGEGLGAEIGAAVLLELEGRVYVPLHDPQGNVIILINPLTKKPVQSSRYSAFGEVQTDTVLSPWGFSSKYYEPETGLSYFGRRYYSAQCMRWITPDPQGFHDGPNLFAYVQNNPMTHFDLYGLFTHGQHERGLLNPLIRALFDADSRFNRRSESIKFECSHTTQVDRHFKEKSTSYQLSGRDLSDRRVTWHNGMSNRFEDSVNTAHMISQKVGGCNVHGVHYMSHGLVDAFEAFLNYCGVITSPGLLQMEMWDRCFNAMSPEGIILHQCHSQGVLHTRNALKRYPEDLRQRIYVIAVAPAAYISPDLCGKVAHLVSRRDFVPWIDFIGRFKYADTIQLLEPHENASFFDHSFSSPTYVQPIEHTITRFLKK